MRSDLALQRGPCSRPRQNHRHRERRSAPLVAGYRTRAPCLLGHPEPVAARPGLGAGLVMLSVVRFSWEYSENTRLRAQRDELLGIAIGETTRRRTTEPSQLGRAQSR